LGGNQARMNSNIQANLGGCRGRSECIRTRRQTSNWHRVIDQA
jgi:hypothetical protein